jgi:hypothetical protein
VRPAGAQRLTDLTGHVLPFADAEHVEELVPAALAELVARELLL